MKFNFHRFLCSIPRNFADDCSACWQVPQMQTQRLVLIWMLPGHARDSTGVVCRGNEPHF